MTQSYNRRASDKLGAQGSDSRDEILDALAAVADPSQRVILTILLRVVDEISSKIDRVLADEERLRMIVLGEFSHAHAVHHKYIEDLIAAYPATQRAVKQMQDTHHAEAGHCAFAAEHIAKDKASSGRWNRIADGVLEKIVLVALSAWAGSHIPAISQWLG